MSPAQTKSAAGWNHNIHYHPMVLRAVPANSARALDVGCGRGLLAYKLAEKCREVIAIDADRDTLSQAGDSIANPSFIEGDVMT